MASADSQEGFHAYSTLNLAYVLVFRPDFRPETMTDRDLTTLHKSD